MVARATTSALAAWVVEHAPVGFGSHHWWVTTADGCRWFATADDLRTRRVAAFAAALRAAHDDDEDTRTAWAGLRAVLEEGAP